MYFYGRKEKSGAIRELMKRLTIDERERLQCQGRKEVVNGVECMRYQYFIEKEDVGSECNCCGEWQSDYQPKIICEGLVPLDSLEEKFRSR